VEVVKMGKRWGKDREESRKRVGIEVEEKRKRYGENSESVKMENMGKR
jgi:hypothetical protein